MKSSTASEYIVLTALTLIAGCVFYREHLAQSAPPAHRSDAPRLVLSHPDHESREDAAITAQERQVIHDYVAACFDSDRYGSKGQNVKPLPPGLTRKKSHGRNLSPGWEQNLVRGKVIPAEILHECYILPPEVTVHLPPPPSGTILVAIDGKVLRLARASMEILDVFDARG